MAALIASAVQIGQQDHARPAAQRLEAQRRLEQGDAPRPHVARGKLDLSGLQLPQLSSQTVAHPPSLASDGPLSLVAQESKQVNRRNVARREATTGV